MERVLLDAFPRSTVEKQTTFSSMKALKLVDLPKLECISEFSFPFPCLEDIIVTNCPLLRKLPFTSDSTNKPSLRIEGSSTWWNGLQWQDEATKSSFQPFLIVI
ncbi:mitogen-activated protein kinase kinase [Ranunculus cassubicifolius]